MTDTAELRKLAELAKVFANATGRRTPDYGEVSGDNFQMMTMHENPEELAKLLSTTFTEAAAVLTRLEKENIQLKFACGYPMPADLETHILPANPFKCGTCDAKDAEIAALKEKVKRQNEMRQNQIAYSCDLQRIIEDICNGRDIRAPETSARFHYDMAVKFSRAAQEAGHE